MSGLQAFIVWFQKISILPPAEEIGNPGEEGGSQKPKNLKQCMKLNWNFQRGGGLQGKSLPCGVWIFSGTTHYVQDPNILLGFTGLINPRKGGLLSK